MILVQYVSLAGSLLFLALVLYTVRKGKLQEAYALLWVFASLLLLVLSLSMKLLRFLADCMGIHTPAFALLLCLTGGLVLLLFQCSVILSSHQRKITLLAEEVALLKKALTSRENSAPNGEK